MKLLNILRISTFGATLLTTIPLFINYLNKTEPRHEMITHLHVWFGIAFFIVAIISMAKAKKQKT